MSLNLDMDNAAACIYAGINSSYYDMYFCGACSRAVRVNGCFWRENKVEEEGRGGFEAGPQHRFLWFYVLHRNH